MRGVRAPACQVSSPVKGPISAGCPHTDADAGIVPLPPHSWLGDPANDASVTWR